MSERIQQIDDNGRTIDVGGLRSRAPLTLDASNETKTEPLFRITGSILVQKLYGVVKTVVGANHTAAYFRLNDQTAQSDITLNTGTTISSAAVGSILVKKGLAAAALTLLTSAQESQNQRLWKPIISPPLLLLQKTERIRILNISIPQLLNLHQE